MGVRCWDYLSVWQSLCPVSILGKSVVRFGHWVCTEIGIFDLRRGCSSCNGNSVLLLCGVQNDDSTVRSNYSARDIDVFTLNDNCSFTAGSVPHHWR